MCDFVDQNGVVLAPGDKVEYWSQGRADWIPATVQSVESKRVLVDQKPVAEIKIFVVTNYPSTSGMRYGNHIQRLTKSANVRRVP